MDAGPLTTGRWRRSPLEAVALLAAVMPTVVMVGRAAASGWVPLFDAAYFTVRSRDVLSRHNPLVGAWSNGSRVIGVWLNNLGPLQLDLLAPFTKLDPYWGTALGVGAVNVAAIVGVWLVARRLFGTRGVLAAMAATVLLQVDEGSLMLIEARQQLAMLMPLWCVLWLAAAAWTGRRWAAPWLLFAASLIVQSHFTYGYVTVAVTVAGLVALVVRHRDRVGELLRTGIVCLVVVALVWAMPLWDQVAGTGNLGRVVARGGEGGRAVGWVSGVRIMAESVFLPPFAAPGSMGDLLRVGGRPSTIAAVGAIAVWGALLVLVLVRSGSSSLSAMAGIGLVAVASAAVAVAQIPPTEQFGVVAQNYYWLWPVGVFAALTVVGATLRAPVARLAAHGVAPLAVEGVLAGVVVLGSLALLRPTNELPETRAEWAISRQLARPLMDELRGALGTIPTERPVLVDLGSVPHVRYTLLVELQRRGIDFRFAPGTTDLSRFGRERCDDGSAAWLLSLRGGADAIGIDRGRGDERLLAAVPGLGSGGFRRQAELAAEFGDALRDGRVVVRDSAVTALGGAVPTTLDAVRTTAGMPARHLAGFLEDWSRYGAVDVAGELRAPLAEWRSLDRSADDDRMAIYARPISPARPDLCATIPPGTVS